LSQANSKFLIKFLLNLNFNLINRNFFTHQLTLLALGLCQIIFPIAGNDAQLKVSINLSLHLFWPSSFFKFVLLSKLWAKKWEKKRHFSKWSKKWPLNPKHFLASNQRYQNIVLIFVIYDHCSTFCWIFVVFCGLRVNFWKFQKSHFFQLRVVLLIIESELEGWLESNINDYLNSSHLKAVLETSFANICRDNVI